MIAENNIDRIYSTRLENKNTKFIVEEHTLILHDVTGMLFKMVLWIVNFGMYQDQVDRIIIHRNKK